jgi:hypothetical protein
MAASLLKGARSRVVGDMGSSRTVANPPPPPPAAVTVEGMGERRLPEEAWWPRTVSLSIADGVGDEASEGGPSPRGGPRGVQVLGLRVHLFLTLLHSTKFTPEPEVADRGVHLSCYFFALTFQQQRFHCGGGHKFWRSAFRENFLSLFTRNQKPFSSFILLLISANSVSCRGEID